VLGEIGAGSASRHTFVDDDVPSETRRASVSQISGLAHDNVIGRS